MPLILENNNLIFLQNHTKTHLNSNNTFVKDFKLKIEVNKFQIIRTRNITQSLDNLELEINNYRLDSKIRNLENNNKIQNIDLQIQATTATDTHHYNSHFKMSFEQNRIKLDIILKDNTFIEKLLKILERNNRPSILNIEVNLQGIEGLYPVIASYDNVVSKEIQPEFDIGVLYDHSVIELNRDLKERTTLYHNNHSITHNINHISFFITDTINNES
ncbi:hypothetical protein Megpolyxen_01873 (plasmid) [Candidatus Megaera polyxenophila]|nr:hypothetical protein Megpolyxen_01873 [Candidatus Megaera polyxenophila]